jgi:hypothetical protein
MAIVAAVTDPGELGADFASFGGTDGGVAGKGLLPVVAGLGGVSGGVIDVAEADVGVGLLVLVASLAGQTECRGVLAAGVVCLADGEVRLAQAIERLGLTGPVAGLAEQGLGLPELVCGLLAAAQPQVDEAEIAQGTGFAVREWV